MLRAVLSVLLGLLVTGMLSAQTEQRDTVIYTAGAPIVFQGDTLFSVYRKVGAFSPAQRARLVRENIRDLAALPAAQFDSLTLSEGESGAFEILHRDRLISSVTAQDAAAEGLSALQLAERNRARIRAALLADYHDASLTTLLRDAAMFVVLVLLFVSLWVAINRGFDLARLRLRMGLRAFVERHSNGAQAKIFKLLGPSAQSSMLLAALRVVRVLTLMFLLYMFLPFTFSQLAYTRGFGEQLLGYVLQPVVFVWTGIINFIPAFVFILVICWVAFQLIKLVGWIADKVRTDEIRIEGFHSDWAKPTANLVRALIVVLTVIIVFPYLPGSNSPAFQGVSVFLGLLLSLGGAAAIGNVVSGVILTYMRPFQVGHRVKINDTVGDVVSRNLLMTRLRTTKNEEITLPNAGLLSGGIINYTTLAQSHGLVLHTSVTIGYDVPWPQVHQLLLAAAARTPALQQNPAPFILQKALQDWYVEYELNAYTGDSHGMAAAYSALHAHIQDVFREANVEIMSSHYMHVRTGNESTIAPASTALGGLNTAPVAQYEHTQS